MSQALDFYATDDAVAGLEARLATAQGPQQRLPLVVALAWQMRQRDMPRALALADEAQASIADTTTTQRGLQARLMLVRGEAHVLTGALDASSALCTQALQHFAACEDAIGAADAHWLQFSIALGQGDAPGADAALQAVATAARQGQDPVRTTAALAARAARDAYRDTPAAQQQWGAQFAAGSAGMHPAAATWVEGFLAAIASQRGEHAESIRHHGSSYTQALASGQVRRAVVVATNLGVEFSNLNDHHAALEWMQRGADLARPHAWPGTMGVALLQTAGILRELQRYDAARELLQEAMQLMAPLAASRNYAVALRYLGEVELKRQQYGDALAGFQMLEQRATALKASDLLCNALRGQAQALLDLDQAEAALDRAQAALAAAQGHALHQIDALRVLADIHARHPVLPAPAGMRAASASLHYLQQAQDAAATIENYTVPGDLLEAIAQAHADVGDTASAFALSKQAAAARQTTHSQEASKRAVALQVSFETQRVQAEERHQRQLAEANAERANLLEQANAAYHAVLENAQDAIVLTDSQGRIRHWNHQAMQSFGWTLDEALGQDILAMLFPERVRGEVGAAIARQHTTHENNTPRRETTAVRRDGSEFPIELSVTSLQVRGQFECSFFIRDITQRVKAALEIAESMAQQQQLADLKSRFVAIASHEFRTPLATILSSSDLLKLYGARMDEQEREGCFTFISEAVHRMKNMLEDVLLIGTTEAGVSQFKPSAHALGPLCESVLEEARRGFTDPAAAAAHPVDFRIADPLCLADLDERWFRHIFGNLLSNAIKYSPAGGVVRFEATVHTDTVEFLVADQGIGLPQEDIPRLFETFFRASNSGKISGTGLGLSIAKRAVELHGGRISVASQLGQGTRFTVVLPLRQPQ